MYRMLVLLFFVALALWGCSAGLPAGDQPLTGDQAGAKDPFFAYFENEPLVETRAGACPLWPSSGQGSLVQEAVDNYLLVGKDGNATDFGLTGLIAVSSWNSTCYGSVEPGTAFLFPGSVNPSAAWQGQNPKIDCQGHAPIDIPSGKDPLHKQMATNLLQKSTTDFVGFSVRWTANGPAAGFNSGACNPHWFNDRALGTCGGHDWHSLAHQMINNQLPSILEQLREAQEGASQAP